MHTVAALPSYKKATNPRIRYLFLAINWLVMKQTMKKRVVIILVCITLSIFLNSCVYTYIYEKSYYSNEDNYIEITGIITFINLEDDRFYFAINSENAQLNSETFLIKESNFEKLKEINFFDNVFLNQTITFICAPRTMYDAQCLPVASVLTEYGYVPTIKEGIKNVFREHKVF